MNKELDFAIEVRVEFWPVDKAIDIDDVKVMLSYDVDFEYRSWGIKGIYSRFQDELTIAYIERDADDRETEKEITIKPNELRRDYVRSCDGIGTPESIEIWLNEDGSVDYERSTITIWMAES